jgi:multisubunit Na+/H+ antiporter MnhG subunit
MQIRSRVRGKFMLKTRLTLVAFVLILQLPVLLHALASAARQAAAQQRKTSKPYTGDLSIFDAPGRGDVFKSIA